MATHGYSYQTPTQPATHHWPKTPTPAEVATATADVSCKAQVNLPNTVLTVEAAYQQALLPQNLPAFTHLQTAFRKLMQRAENLLSHNSPPPVRREPLLRIAAGSVRPGCVASPGQRAGEAAASGPLEPTPAADRPDAT